MLWSCHPFRTLWNFENVRFRALDFKLIRKPTLFVLKIRYRFFNGKRIINQSGCDKNPLKWKFDLLIENTKTIKAQLFFIGITDFNSLQINE